MTRNYIEPKMKYLKNWEMVESEGGKTAHFSMNMGKEIYSILLVAFIIRGKIGSNYFFYQFTRRQ